MELRLSSGACRVLGSLLEKEITVPSTYPMTLNALVGACNQTSGRNPVTAMTEDDVTAALGELRTIGLTRVVHASHGARTTRYRQVLDEVVELDAGQRAVLTLLLLRGHQTPGELRSRAERLHPFASIDEVEGALASLAARDRPLVRELPRRTGHKEPRWAHLLAGDVVDEPASGSAAAPPVAAPVELHPLAEALRPFVGTWEGSGEGEYPTIEPFTYLEEIELRPVPGKPLLAYRSSTRHPTTGAPMHAESGWLRPTGDDAVELVLSQGSGLVEVAEGLHQDGELVLASTLVAGATTAKEVTATERRYTVAGDELTYDLAMAAVGVPLTHHLRATLRRTR